MTYAEWLKARTGRVGNYLRFVDGKRDIVSDVGAIAVAHSVPYAKAKHRDLSVEDVVFAARYYQELFK